MQAHPHARTWLFAACAWLSSAAPFSGAVDLIAYIPDYRMSDTNYVDNILPSQLALLDEVRYFGMTVTASGGVTTSPAHTANINLLKQKINSLPTDQRPRLGITLGGDGASANFPAVAQSASLRTQLADNIASLLNDTGAVGVDIDWEHPADGVQLTTQYPALLARIKESVGARRVYATVSPEKILPKSAFEGEFAIDGASIMTYDLGWWANDSLDPNLGQHSLQSYVEDTVKAWTNTAGAAIPRTWVFGSKRSVDAPESKLGVGAPFYARGYDGTNHDLAIGLRQIGAPWTTSDDNAYHDPTKSPPWKIWLPGKELVADRMAYAAQTGLQHIIFWELWHDLAPNNEDSLLRAAYETRAALTGDFNADHLVDGADLAAWQQNFGDTTEVTGPMGDADNNNRIDGRDFLIWQRHAGSGVSAEAVPEPCTHQLVGLLLILLWPRRATTGCAA